MTSVLIVRKPFLLLTCCCCWRVKDERDREEPIYSFVKRGRYPHYLTPLSICPLPLRQWGRGSLTQTYDWSMNGDSKYLSCCEWRKKTLRFHLPLRLIEKRFEIPAHTLKNLIFFCPIICIPLALCGFRFKFWTLLCTYNYNGEKSTKKVIHSRVQKSNWIPRAEGKMKIIGQKKIKFFSGHRYISKHLFIRCKEMWILSITIFFSFVAYSVSIILIEGFR